MNSLLSGVAGDVQAFAAVVSLIESLAEVGDVPAIETTMRTWSAAHADADRVMLTLLEPGDGVAPEVTAKREAGLLLTVPVPAEPPARLAFHTARSADAISDSYRRLLIVAGVVCSAALIRLRAKLELEHQRETLRQLAVGSARGFLGTSPAALDIARRLPRFAATKATLMLLGESGVGKSFLARLIHETGAREGAVPYDQLRGDPRGARGERAIRSRARRVLWRSRGARGGRSRRRTPGRSSSTNR